MTVSSITEKSQAVELYGTQAVEGVTPPEEFRVEENNTNNDTRTEMRTEQKKKEGGGCAKIFSMILQIVAAVVAVVGGPKGIAIAAALNAAAKAIAPAEQSGGSTNTAPVDTKKLYADIDNEADRIERELAAYLPSSQQPRPTTA